MLVFLFNVLSHQDYNITSRLCSTTCVLPVFNNNVFCWKMYGKKNSGDDLTDSKNWQKTDKIMILMSWKTIYVAIKITGIRQIYDMENIYDIARIFFGIRTNFWCVKLLWHRERHYVAIPYMAVWKCLACLAPDAHGLIFADAARHSSLGLSPLTLISSPSTLSCQWCWGAVGDEIVMHWFICLEPCRSSWSWLWLWCVLRCGSRTRCCHECVICLTIGRIRIKNIYIIYIHWSP
jgi:hypothetical protein